MTGINARMVHAMATQAGLSAAHAASILLDLTPVARFDGCAYFSATKASRAIAKAQHGGRA